MIFSRVLRNGAEGRLLRVGPAILPRRCAAVFATSIRAETCRRSHKATYLPLARARGRRLPVTVGRGLPFYRLDVQVFHGVTPQSSLPPWEPPISLASYRSELPASSMPTDFVPSSCGWDLVRSFSRAPDGTLPRRCAAVTATSCGRMRSLASHLPPDQRSAGAVLWTASALGADRLTQPQPRSTRGVTPQTKLPPRASLPLAVYTSDRLESVEKANASTPTRASHRPLSGRVVPLPGSARGGAAARIVRRCFPSTA
jgi:hypothetical protein